MLVVVDAKPKLLDVVRARIRAKHYSYRTEEQYVDWIRRFILYSGKRHPADMSGPDVSRYLSQLDFRSPLPSNRDLDATGI